MPKNLLKNVVDLNRLTGKFKSCLLSNLTVSHSEMDGPLRYNRENVDRKYIFAVTEPPPPPPSNNAELQKIIAKHMHDCYEIRKKNVIKS